MRLPPGSAGRVAVPDEVHRLGRPGQRSVVTEAGVVATSTPRATTCDGRTWRRTTSNGPLAGSSRKLAGRPGTMPYSSPRPSTAAARPVTIAKHSATSAGEVSWVACAPTKATCTGFPVPSGYQGSMMSSWPNATLMPAASISLTLVSPRRLG